MHLDRDEICVGRLEGQQEHHAAYLVIICIDTSAATLKGRAIGVHEGDTTTILDATRKQYKIRLAQIDAPEIPQAFGNQSKNHYPDIVFGKSVKVVQEGVDRYGRIVGRVYVNGIDVSAEQVRRGYDVDLYRLDNDKDGIPCEKLCR